MSRRLSILAVLALAASACAPKQGAPAPVENPKFTFSHSPHVEARLSCTTCHAPVVDATQVGPTVHVALPSGASAEACGQCHDKIPAAPPSRRIELSLTFSHAAHLPRTNRDCTRCHSAFAEPGMTQAPRPPMSACTDCHEHAQDYAQARCQPCHLDLKRYAIRTRPAGARAPRTAAPRGRTSSAAPAATTRAPGPPA
jgi:c(7)-type cytochrome triheme protein